MFNKAETDNGNGYIATLLALLAPYRKAVTFGLVAAMISASFDAIGPMVMKWGVDNLKAGQPLGWLYAFSGGLIVVAALSGLFRYWMRNIVIGTSRKVDYDLKQSFFAHLMALAPSFFDKNHTGDLMARATDDIERMRMVVGPALQMSVATLLVMIVSAVMMFSLDPLLATIVFFLAPIIGGAVLMVSASLHRANLLQQEVYGELTTQVQENLSGIRVVKAFSREDNEKGAFDKQCERYYRRSLDVAFIQALFMPLIALLISLGSVAVLWVGGSRVISGTISLGDFIAFMGYLSLMSWPMISIGWIAHLYQRGRASHKRLEQIFSVEEQFKPGVSETPVVTPVLDPAVPPEIVFKDIVFRYREEGQYILNRINLTIPSGATVVIVGKTGSGKSTITRLLARLYEPESGQILINGIRWDSMPIHQLRSMIGYVDQTPFMFSATIRENILFGSNGSDHANGEGNVPGLTVEEAAHISVLDKDVEGFAEKYETILGERGVTLSGGQQQRLTLARALMSETPILVLDDSLSAVDTDTEREIITRLAGRLTGRTNIIITHRLAVAEKGDLVVVLDEGKIVEAGSHNELIANDGEYAKMYSRQRLTDELGAIV